MAEEIQEETRLPAPGVKLKMCREARNLSIEEVAEKLHLRPSVVAELESDVIDHNISMTFTRGYIRLYARYLDLDPAPLLEEFDELANPVKQPAKLQSFSQKVAKQASDTRLMMFSYFVLFVIIALAVIWWFQQPGSGDVESPATATGSTSVQAEQSQDNASVQASMPVPAESFAEEDLIEPEAPVSAVDEPVQTETEDSSETTAVSGINVAATDVLSSNTSDTEADNQTPEEALPEITNDAAMAEDGPEETNSVAVGSNESNQSEVDEPLSPEQTEVQPLSEPGADVVNTSTETELQDEVNAPSETAYGEPVELVFTFSEDCWMNLTDATGEAIAYGIKAAGRVMPVSGIPPFEVKLGAPQAVSLTVDGEPFDMSGFPAGRTATFIIGETR